MKLKLSILYLFLFFCNAAFPQASFLNITNYQVYFGSAHNDQQDYMVLRQFENEGKTYYLLVNLQTLETSIEETSIYDFKPMSLTEARTLFRNSPYMKAIRAAELRSKDIQDAGIECGMPGELGVSLTADLCPSHKPLDKAIFTAIIKQFQQVEKPVPVAIAISGVWIRQHPQDLEWLKNLAAEQEIYINWINHSFNHHVSATRPLKENFLLEPGTDIDYEVLETEKVMLKAGLLPSVFFRFPGLVSNQQLVHKITGFGLIPLGSDAWLAKGQHAVSGSIVLIHVNGNEHTGIEHFVKLLKENAAAIAKKQWSLFDLRASVGEIFEADN